MADYNWDLNLKRYLNKKLEKSPYMEVFFNGFFKIFICINKNTKRHDKN